MTHTVWAQVTVLDGRPGEESPRLVGGLDPDKARDALASLLAFVPGYGPSALFNESNPMYRPRTPLGKVIRDRYDVDPDEIVAELDRRAAQRIERRAPTRQPEWARDHPIAAAETTWAKQQMAREHTQILDFMAHPQTRNSGLDGIATLVQERRPAPNGNLRPVTGEDLAEWCKGDEDAPLMSEAYLYTLLGKDIARSVLTRLRALSVALGAETIYEHPPTMCPTCDRAMP